MMITYSVWAKHSRDTINSLADVYAISNDKEDGFMDSNDFLACGAYRVTAKW